MHCGTDIRSGKHSCPAATRVGGGRTRVQLGVRLVGVVPLRGAAARVGPVFGCVVGFAIGCVQGASAQVVPDTARAPQSSAATAAQSATPPSTPEARPQFPDDPRLAIALTMLSKGAVEQARQTAHTVLVANSDCDRAAAIEGIALNKLKRYEEAKPLLARARDSKQPFPEQKHAAHFLGWCHYHLGELELAKAAFDLHLVSVPNEPDSTFGLGLIALAEDQLEKADVHFAAALDGFSKPRDRPVDRARVLTRQADVALRRDDVAGAEVILRRAIEASAVQHETWSKLARVYDRQGKTKEADAARANADRILTALGRKPAAEATSAGGATTDPRGTPESAAPVDGAPTSAPSAVPPSKSESDTPKPPQR